MNPDCATIEVLCVWPELSQFVTVYEVAKWCVVAPRTVCKWMDSGILPGIFVPVYGPLRPPLKRYGWGPFDGPTTTLVEQDSHGPFRLIWKEGLREFVVKYNFQLPQGVLSEQE